MITETAATTIPEQARAATADDLVDPVARAWADLPHAHSSSCYWDVRECRWECGH